MIKTFDTNVFLPLVAAYDIAEKVFYVSYVNVNTGHGNEVEVPEDARYALAWFIKQFVH